MDEKKSEVGECTDENAENGNTSNERSKMDKKKSEAGQCTEENAENGNSSNERSASSIDNSSTIRVAGDKNAVYNNCIINMTNQESKPPKRTAPPRKKDKGPPKKKKKKKAGSDKPFSEKGRKMSDESLPGTSGSDWKSGCGKKSAGKTKISDTDKEIKPKVKCSKLSTLFKNVKKSYPLIRVMIYDVEVQSSQRKDTKKWLPGTFRVIDSTGWGYLIVFDKAKGKIFKQGQSIEVSNVKAINKEELTCNAGSVKSSSEPVQISDCDVNKMNREEKSTTLKQIRKGNLIKKTKVIIFEVGELQTKYNYEVRELKVKASRTSTDIETLEAYNVPAKFKYKIGQEVKIARVKYDDGSKKFKTVGDCAVKITSQDSAVEKKPCLQDESVDEKDLQGLGEKVTEEELRDISPKIANERRKVARYLGFEAYEIDIIEADCDGAGKGGITETALKMLIEWKQRNGKQATKEVLINALKKSKLVTVAEELERRIR